MPQRILGRTGWPVSPIGFGGWGIGGQWGRVETQTALDAIRAALDAGVNFFDTADAYGEPPGFSEELLGRGLGKDRSRVLIATKVGNWARRMGEALSFTHWLHVSLCCDASLHRLRADCIDLYQCHLGDLKQPDVFLEAFERLREKGKIRAFGLSTHLLQTVALFDRDSKLAAVQLDYSLLNRAPEQDLLPYCREKNLGVIVRGPLAQGLLTGKFTRETKFGDWVRSKWNREPEREVFLKGVEQVERLRFLATPERTLAQAALQFVLAHPAVSVAIPGAKSAEQARANAAASGGALSAEDLNRARQVTEPAVPPSPTAPGKAPAENRRRC